MTEFINTEIYRDETFDEAAKNFSEDSINSLFDVNKDGRFSALEADRANSLVLENELSSIHPLVAKAFNDETFAIQQGMFLTQSQYKANQLFDMAVQKWIAFDEQQKSMERRMPVEKLNIEMPELLNTDLSADLDERQYLERQEIDNGV